jgi:hypothetical protein
MARLRFTNRFRVCDTVTLPVEIFSATGEQCLNCLCQPRGQARFPATNLNDEYRMTLEDFLTQLEYLVQAVEAVDDAARKDFKLAFYS